MPENERGQGEAHRLAFRFYVLFAPLLYLLFALLTPPFQTPDEQQHLFRAWQLSQFELIGERQGEVSGGYLPKGVADAAATELGTRQPHARMVVTQTSWSERFSRATPIGSEQPRVFTNFVGSVSYSPVGYIPQVIAVWFGRALALPVEWIVRLGRVLNAGLTFVLLFAALRALPVGRLVLLAVALLPMTAACAGSFGQDGLVIGASAWLVALCLRAVLSGSWRQGDVGAAVALTLVVTLTKLVYLPLAGLGLLLRDSGGRWRIGWPALAAGVVAALAVLIWLMPNGHLVVRAKPQLAVPSEQLAYLIQHPAAFPSAVIDTYTGDGLVLVRTLFQFAWLTVGPVYLSLFPAVGALLLALLAGDRRGKGLCLSWRVWAVTVCLVNFVAIAFTMYLAATPLGARNLFGLQGRYLLPLLLPLFVALLPTWSKAPADWLVKAIMGAMLFANVAALASIAEAFYA